jgi:hypothetical protein
MFSVDWEEVTNKTNCIYDTGTRELECIQIETVVHCCFTTTWEYVYKPHLLPIHVLADAPVAIAFLFYT